MPISLETPAARTDASLPAREATVISCAAHLEIAIVQDFYASLTRHPKSF